MTEVIVAILMAIVTVGIALFGWLRVRDSARFHLIEKNAIGELVKHQGLIDTLKHQTQTDALVLDGVVNTLRQTRDETHAIRAETNACLKERQIIVGQLAISDRKLLQQGARIRELEQKLEQLEKGVGASGLHLGGET